MTRTTKLILIFLIAGLGIFTITFVSPIAQDPAYHNFSDKRTLHGVSNFWNVASNLPFILFGLLGLYASSKQLPDGRLKQTQRGYTLFFTGAILVGLGSSYYHLNPSVDTLFWDRLPMTIAFMALFSIIIAEYLSLTLGRLLFIPLLAIGAGSVMYWFNTEQMNAGDLRPYALVQFLPMILIPLILILFRSAYRPSKYLWMMLVMYGLSKAFEHFDGLIFHYLGEISGHTLKHVVAALGIFFFQLHFISRLKRNDG